MSSVAPGPGLGAPGPASKKGGLLPSEPGRQSGPKTPLRTNTATGGVGNIYVRAEDLKREEAEADERARQEG